MSEENELKTLEEIQQENDFSIKFSRVMANFVICLILIVILCVCIFSGKPDIIDSLINYLNKGAEACQSLKSAY